MKEPEKEAGRRTRRKRGAEEEPWSKRESSDGHEEEEGARGRKKPADAGHSNSHETRPAYD